MKSLKPLIQAGMLVAGIGILAGCKQLQLDADPGVSLELAHLRAEKLSDIQYQLHLVVPPDKQVDIEGHIIVSFDLTTIDQPITLDFRESPDKVKKLLINGRSSNYQFVNEHIVIPTKKLWQGKNKIEIDFIAGSSSLNRNPEYLYTLFVPDRARTAFPLFDQPDLKSVYRLSLEVPGGWKALSNAPVETITEQGASTLYEFSPTRPISSYLFSFVAGAFESVTRVRDGRTMTMLHRESDPQKLERNLDAIFELHAESLAWMETYSGIPYPYQKFDFALIPAFQYGGMEHAGAIQYRASSLLLDEAPSDTELLNRASLIAHETAHMWFGNLVTMRWFNDVWTKEVFANFMAAKIVNPGFPEINHALNFLVGLYPAAYSVDRTPGSNAIRQHLDNLNQAGQMYGAIIYNKAPIMMRQLEAMIGEDEFREGMREYLATFSHANASWPELIAILDKRSSQDLAAWSEVWVNTPGRPHFEFNQDAGPVTGEGAVLQQIDPAGMDRVWPQRFALTDLASEPMLSLSILSDSAESPVAGGHADLNDHLLFNSDGFGYGLFPADLNNLQFWSSLDDLKRGSLLINLFEQMLAEANPQPDAYFLELQSLAINEENQLLLDLALTQLRTIYWRFMDPWSRNSQAPALQSRLWQAMLDDEESSRKKIWFDSFTSVAITRDAIQKLYTVWNGELVIDGLILSEKDLIKLSQLLAIKMPGRVEEILSQQLQRTQNADDKRRLTFLGPSLSDDQGNRDAFFASLAQEENRQTESWVLEALANLHHPLRVENSEHYLQETLELLEEVQVTGDIFFPKAWVAVSLGNYSSDSAVTTVKTFLEQNPDYNPQLRMKILQAADPMFRANRILKEGRGHRFESCRARHIKKGVFRSHGLHRIPDALDKTAYSSESGQ